MKGKSFKRLSFTLRICLQIQKMKVYNQFADYVTYSALEQHRILKKLLKNRARTLLTYGWPKDSYRLIYS